MAEAIWWMRNCWASTASPRAACSTRWCGSGARKWYTLGAMLLAFILRVMCRLVRVFPELVLNQGSCLCARLTHYSRYLHFGSQLFSVGLTSVSFFALDGGGRRARLWAVHHLLRNAPGAG